jgi:hypothetical protein
MNFFRYIAIILFFFTIFAKRLVKIVQEMCITQFNFFIDCFVLRANHVEVKMKIEILLLT